MTEFLYCKLIISTPPTPISTDKSRRKKKSVTKEKKKQQSSEQIENEAKLKKEQALLDTVSKGIISFIGAQIYPA